VAQYTDTQKAEAIDLYEEIGMAETSRRLGIPKRTIGNWVRAADRVVRANPEKIAEMKAQNAQRVQQTWADFREAEALSSGALASRMRTRIRDSVEAGEAGREIQALVTAYAILIDKAEMLSGQATQRIEVWAESELDRELKGLIVDMEAVVRERRTST
jgi:hypothetical protein